MSDTKYYCDDIGVPGTDQSIKSCYDTNVPLVNNIVLWTSIVGFVLFFVHIGWLYLTCKKFSWRSASIILLTAIVVVTIYFSVLLRSKYVISTDSDDETYKTDGYVFKEGIGRNMAYIQLIGNILCLLSIIAFVVWKKSYLYGCDSVFPTMSFGIIIVTWATMMLYGLIHLATNKD
jgi:hypothetical protein